MSRDTKRLTTKADYLQSVAIRLRDTDANLYGACVTCGRTVHAAIAHAGHCISRRHNGTRYDPRNVYLQCYHCNVELRESIEVGARFRAHVEELHGPGTMEELEFQARSVTKLNDYVLRQVCERYEAMIAELAPTKNTPIQLSEKML